MPSGNRSAQVAAGTDRAATRPTRAPITSRMANRAPTARGNAPAPEPHRGLEKELQHEGEYNGRMIELAT